MENIAIQTSQNITIEQTIASIGERVVAAGIDYFFYGIYFLIITMIGAISRSTPIIVLLMLPAVFYHLICESAMNGQSWGKKIMRIKVAKIDGTEASFSSYFIRWIFRIIDITICFGAISTLFIIINGKGQRIGDIVASTTVLRIRDDIFDNTIYTNIPEGYTQIFFQVIRLTDSDIYTAKEVLDFLDGTRSIEAMNMADKAKKAIESKMGIQSEMNSKKFLQTIINDYNYLHSR